MKLYFYLYSEEGAELFKTAPATKKNIDIITKMIGDVLKPNTEETIRVAPEGEWKLTVILK